MTSIKDQGEGIIVHGDELRISSFANSKMFKTKGTFIALAEKLNMGYRKYLGLLPVNHLKSLKLADIRAEDIKVLIGADVPETSRQLHIKSRDKGEPIAIKTPLLLGSIWEQICVQIKH